MNHAVCFSRKCDIVIVSLSVVFRDVDGRMLLDIFDEKLHPLSVRPSMNITDVGNMFLTSRQSTRGDAPQISPQIKQEQCTPFSLRMHWGCQYLFTTQEFSFKKASVENEQILWLTSLYMK